jgi:hypothetical protein
MKLISGFALAGLLAVFAVACGGDDAGGDADAGLANEGFVVPTQATLAYTEVAGVWELQGPADWSCFDTPTDDLATAAPINLTGTLRDFQTDVERPDASITVYEDTNFSGAGVAMGDADDDGLYAVTLPAGGTRWAFKVVLPGDALDTYTLNQYFEPAVTEQSEDFNSVSLLTAQALPAFIGVTRSPGLGILAGTIRDCNDNEVEGAIATVSDTRGVPEHLDGAGTFYFSALSTSLPVRNSQQIFTNTDGVFVVIELPAAPQAFLQVWGFLDDADMADGEMTLIAEIPAPVLADAVITASMVPLRQ